VLIGDGHRALTVERRLAREQLVHHDAEGVDVAAGVGGESLRLLRAEVRRGADDGTGPGELLLIVEGAGDAEVGHLHLAVGGQQDVGGLDVTVDQTLGVGGGECGSDSGADLGHSPRQERPLRAHHLPEVSPLDELHHHEIGAVVLAPVVNGDDAGVGQVCGGLCLAPETLYERFAAGVLAVEDLDRDVTPEAEILRHVHVRHSAAGEMGDEGVPVRKDPLRIHGGEW
jgi:hypothetical protein